MTHDKEDKIEVILSKWAKNMNSKLSALQIDTVVKRCLLTLSHSKRKCSMKTDLTRKENIV